MVTCVYSPYVADHAYSGDLDSRRTMPDVDSTMAKITEQREIANEIAEALSNPSGTMDADEVRLSPDLKSAFVLMI